MNKVHIKPITDLHLIPDDEFQRRYSLSLLGVKTLDWEHGHWNLPEDLQSGNQSRSSTATEFIPKGVWRRPNRWLRGEDDYNFAWPWTGIQPSHLEVSNISDRVLAKRSSSAHGRLESFIGHSLHSSEEIKPTLVRPRRDPEPLSGIERPRFIWRVESDMDLSTDRAMQMSEFHDTSFEGRFRVWRRNSQEKQAEESHGVEEEERIEDLLSIEVLEAMEEGFGRRALNLEEYKETCASVLNLPEDLRFPSSLLKLFHRIDTFGVGRITFDDLCDFLQQQFAEKAETEYNTPPVSLFSPSRPIDDPHKSPITKALTLFDGGLFCFSQDGIVSLWHSNFKPRIWRNLGKANRNVHMVEQKSKWYTDIAYIQAFGKFIISTGEQELQIYDAATYDPFCQLVDLYSVPLHIDGKMQGSNLVIVMGDIDGVITILVIEEAGTTLRHWTGYRRINNIPTIKLNEAIKGNKTKYLKFQVHNDLVTHIQFCPTLNRVFSCSTDRDTSLVMGSTFSSRSSVQIMEDLRFKQVQGVTDLRFEPRPRKPQDEVKFPLTNGCKTFDIWEERHLLAAGGFDRIIWVWNVFVPSQPIAKLRGHIASIFKVVFDQESETLFSICTEKSIRVWSLFTNTCIHVFDPKLTLLRGPILYCFFVGAGGVLIQTSDEASYIRLERKDVNAIKEEVKTTHSDPIVALIYNPQHDYIITCSKQDIRVWECETGNLVSAFNTIGGDGSMHLDTIQANAETPMEEENIFIMDKPLIHGREQVDTYNVGTVTCVALDLMGKRFFTAHENGVIKAWNFYNGRNLYNLYKPLKNSNICDLHYVTVDKDHRFLITVGWGRDVVVYVDDQGPEIVHSLKMPDEPIQFANKIIGHKDDIWASSFGIPNLIASGDYSGKLLVWNINSGHVVAYLRPNPCRDQEMMKMREIVSLTFHQNTQRDSTTNYLISSGPYHLMHIWRANTTRELNIGSVGWVRPVSLIKDYVTTIKSFKSNNWIVTADTSGSVTIWEIVDRLGNTEEPTKWFPLKYLERHGGKDKFGFRPPGVFEVTQVSHPKDKKRNKPLRIRRRWTMGKKKSYPEEDYEEEDIDQEVDEGTDGQKFDYYEEEEEDLEGDGEDSDYEASESSSVLSESGSLSEQLKKDIERSAQRVPEHFEEKLRKASDNEKKQLALKAKGFGLGPVQFKIVKSWKCHTEGFASLEIADAYGLIITGGKDKTVRVWDQKGNHIGIFGTDNWLIGDPFTYSPHHPIDVILDLKRVRGHDLFHMPPPPKLAIEHEAEKISQRLLERTEKRMLTDQEIWEKSLAYEKLLSQTVPTTTWFQADTPVGPHNRYKEMQNNSWRTAKELQNCP